jgi:RNA polymerase sigma-70 factor (ECF subfamily)
MIEIAPAETLALLARARTGDAEAFGELCRAYEGRLMRQALYLSGSETQAEELAQETLVEAWRCLRRYQGRCQFFTWLVAILLNRHHNALRHRSPIPFSSLIECDQAQVQDRISQIPDPNNSPDEKAALDEQAAWLRECVLALPPKHRQVIYLRFYVDDSLSEIAGALGCSVGTVKSRLLHALEKLRGMEVMTD